MDSNNILLKHTSGEIALMNCIVLLDDHKIIIYILNRTNI